MRIGNFMIWCSAREAAEFGATHHARIHGVVPGFFCPQSDLWISRSDLFNPIEDALGFFWAATFEILGHEPAILLDVGRPIELNPVD